MKIVADKIQMIVGLRKLDEDGNVIEEIGTDPARPLTLFPKSFGDLASHVEAIVEQANAEAVTHNSRRAT